MTTPAGSIFSRSCDRSDKEVVIGAPLDLIPATTARTFHTPSLAQEAATQVNALFAEYGILSIRAQALPYADLTPREKKRSPCEIKGVWKVVVRSTLDHLDEALLIDELF